MLNLDPRGECNGFRSLPAPQLSTGSEIEEETLNASFIPQSLLPIRAALTVSISGVWEAPYGSQEPGDLIYGFRDIKTVLYNFQKVNLSVSDRGRTQVNRRVQWQDRSRKRSAAEAAFAQGWHWLKVGDCLADKTRAPWYKLRARRGSRTEDVDVMRMWMPHIGGRSYTFQIPPWGAAINAVIPSLARIPRRHGCRGWTAQIHQAVIRRPPASRQRQWNDEKRMVGTPFASHEETGAANARSRELPPGLKLEQGRYGG
ncbi:hypothetical protein FB45DRAFT_1008829 [Roridomyces roridus]|uniref:Uncharacterized protein n=1 Tax=Roridomyces roridus TaxID=1738132 RepID=A0AAD7FDN5_9AGAR|nr:hypothetical protein FB45DRAFT_1008829 [Roridomyces roridus]